MKKHLFAVCIFVAYTVILIKVMVFKDLPTIRVGQLMLNFGGTESGHSPNFVPLRTILPYLLGYKGWIIAGINLFGNIALLVPIGFLIPFVYRNISWKKCLALAFVSGLAIETMQTVLRVGIFDIDDVLLNALGVMVGFWAFLILAKWVRERKYVHILIATFLVMAAAMGAVYFVYPHGQPVVNPRIRAGGQSNNSGNEQEGTAAQNGDLCAGTGGTGEIVNVGNHTITIKSKDGVIQTINLNSRTGIRNSAGSISESNLKIGDHVTVVILDEHKTATTVLVCNK